VRLLLDTHALLWATVSPEILTASARSAIADPDNDVAFSAGSVWELAIKQSAGRLELPGDFVQAILDRRYSELAISVEQALAAAELPAHHRDPFDRMLIAQAQLDGRTIVTRDRVFAAYDVALLPA
jgi:PIN domain nuclease of toxin-antitoxin system